jgi:hypothetical protein
MTGNKINSRFRPHVEALEPRRLLIGDSVVVFNEIMYNPAGTDETLEWVELFNQHSVNIDLSNWRLTGAIDYLFAERTVIQGRGYMVIAADPASLKAATGVGGSLGPFAGELDNGGASLWLKDNNDRIMNEVRYDDHGDWPVGADGSGATLAKLNEQHTSELPENWSHSWLVGGSPGAKNWGDETASHLVINEVTSATDDSFWLEIGNLGPRPIDLIGHALVTSESGSTYTFPSQLVSAGGLVMVDEATMGFDVADGEKLFLYGPNKTELLDSRQVTNRLQGRSPQHNGRWLYLQTATPNAENQFRLRDEIVINEIMYHYQPNLPTPQGTPFSENDEEWIELFNRGTSPVDLSGWTIRDAIAFDFPVGTILDPGEYLVVAKDAVALSAKYASITVVGGYDGTLSNQDDRIQLLDPFQNPADEVHYYDGGRWGDFADGGGSSLELRNPHADNTNADAWATSDESRTSEWHTYTSRRVAKPFEGKFRSPVGGAVPPRDFNDFVFGFLDAGEVLLDAIHVRSSDGAEWIQNTDFEGDSIGGQAFRWRIGGNHHGQVVQDPDNSGNKVLQLRAQSSVGYVSNSAETTFANNRRIVIGQEYEVSFRAKWMGGSRQLNNRAFYSQIAETTRLIVPPLHGTPGARNSRFEANIGPSYRDLTQIPAVPSPNEPVTISIVAEDPDAVTSATLKWSTGGDFTSVVMTAGPGGTFTATVPGQNVRAITQFYIEAVDGMGKMSMFPKAGPSSGAVYEVNDGAANAATRTGIDSLRLILSAANTRLLHLNTNLMSDDFLRGTLVINEREIMHDIGIRLRGSQHSRDAATRVGFSVELEPDRLYRGVHRRFAIDRSTRADNTPTGPAEIIIRQFMNHAGGIASEYGDIIYLVAPQTAHNSPAHLRLAQFGEVYLNSQYENGDDSPLYELEMIFTPPGFVGGNPNKLKLHTGGPFYDYDLEAIGGDKEQYRFHLNIKNNREADDYRRIIQVNHALSIPAGAAFDAALEEVIDVDQWMRAMATKSLTMDFDGYGSVNYRHNHNIMFYVRQNDNKVIAMPWDIDGSFATGFIPVNASIYPKQGTTNLTKLIERPVNFRLFLGHLHDLITTTWNRAYMLPWMQNFGPKAGQNLSTNINLIEARGNFVLSQLPFQLPYNVTTRSGLNVGASSMATVEGLAWINVREIRLAGSDQTLDVTWKTVGPTNYANGWEVKMPVVAGTHDYTFEAFDFQGKRIGSKSISITSTIANPVVESLRITELHYNPADPMAAELATNPLLNNDDFEFIEVQNVGATTLQLLNTHFQNGVTFAFPLVELGAGERGVVVKNLEAFTLRYGAGVKVLGQFTASNLSNNGVRLTLLDGLGQTVVDFSYSDSDPWPESADGVGASLELIDPAGAAPEQLGKYYRWRGSSEFGGSPGAVGRGPVGVVINEVLSRTDLPRTDAIELHNPTTSSVDISGWYLSDARSQLLKYRIPERTVLPAGGYLVYDESHFNPTPVVPAPHHFALNGITGDDVWLAVADEQGRVTMLVDAVHFGAAAEGETWGRAPNGFGRLLPLSRNTLGYGNSRVRVGPLVISEINYNPGPPSPAAVAIDPGLLPDDLEFLEIHNPMERPVELTEWWIRLGIDFDFESGTTIAGGETLVVTSFNPDHPLNASRRDAFRTQYGIDGGVRLLGGFAGQLSDAGESVMLQRRDTISRNDPIARLTADSFVYDDLAPWPAGADGRGSALQRRTPVSEGYDGKAWTATNPTLGSAHFIPNAIGDFTGNSDVDTADIDALLDAIRSGSEIRYYDLNGDGLVNAQDVTFWIVDILGSWLGDANLDGEFNSRDLVLVFTFGQYEDARADNATWQTGDWDGDGDFSSSDFVVAFQSGGYEKGPRPAIADIPGLLHQHRDFVTDRFFADLAEDSIDLNWQETLE